MTCNESIISANYAYLLKSCFSCKTGVGCGVTKNDAGLRVTALVSVHKALE